MNYPNIKRCYEMTLMYKKGMEMNFDLYSYGTLGNSFNPFIIIYLKRMIIPIISSFLNNVILAPWLRKLNNCVCVLQKL